MNLTTFGTGLFVSGLAVLAGILFALQRLRVRHRDVVVVTTLFWPREIEETRARVLVERFRRPWVYVFLLSIAALLWIAVAAPRIGGRDQRERVILIDGSARASIGDRFADSIALAAERVAECPTTKTRVMLAGSRIRTVLDRGESPELLEKRLRATKPESCPSTIERALAEIAAVQWSDGIIVEIVGDMPVASDAIAALPGDVEVAALAMPERARPERNAGIVALGVTEAAAGSYANVDLFVAIAATSDSDLREPKATLVAGETQSPLGLTPVETTGAPSFRRFVARDVAADGRGLIVDLGGGDDLAADDVARCFLPTRQRISVAIEPDAPAALVAALGADPGVEIVQDTASAVVAVRRAASSFGASLPSLVLTDAGSEVAAFRLRLEIGSAERSDAVFARLVNDLALREIDAVSLATTAGREIRAEAVLGEPLEPRAIEVWEVLFGSEYDFAESASFPRFVAEGVRYLAAVPPLVSEVAVGRPIRESGERAPLVDGSKELATLGDVVVPPRVGEYTRSDARVVHASLLDPTTTLGTAATAAELPKVERLGGVIFDPAWLALVVAFLLLIGEWLLVRRERIP